MDKDDDVVVHDVHGAGYQSQSAQSARCGVLVLSDGERPARGTRFRHRVRYDDKRSALLPTGYEQHVIVLAVDIVIYRLVRLRVANISLSNLNFD